MQGAVIVILLTVFALAVIPLTIGYYLWLARTVVPRVASLPPAIARRILAMYIALPWIVIAVTVWWILR